MHMTVGDMLLEPIDQIHFAIAVWEADAKRDKLEGRKQEAAAEGTANQK